ncbi:MAG: class I SAM-dependent methyltransferase, partial [Thaumarchaeota archaeon]|nr:class I SAM-dependent methyltransferase [Nitrososphaerota archaeon]
RDHISDFFADLKSEKYPSKKKPYPIDYSLDDNSGLFLYMLCKIIKPTHMVETGVAYGLSSMYVLQAMEENKKGILHSVDAVFSPWQTKDMIGSVIPSSLKNRWDFNFGSATDKLNNVLSSLGSVDIFLHDSLHTYKNMMFEFETAWPYIAPGGFLISDDIGDNNAFYDFCTKMNLDSIILKQKSGSYLGLVQKS